MPNFCSECGAKLEPNAKFCSNCGTPVPGAVAAAPAPAPKPAPKPASSKPASASDGDILQAELYSLYRAYEPARALYEACCQVNEKVTEMCAEHKQVVERFHNDLVYYLPFSSNRFVDENLVKPKTKEEIKSWKAYVKRYRKDRPAMEEGDYDLQDIYALFKRNESKILKKRQLSFTYYKMAYCFEEPETPEKYWSGTLYPEKGKHIINDYKLINFDNFITNFLPKKLGDNCESYLFKLADDTFSGHLGGELQLHDVTTGYAFVPSIEKKGVNLYDKSLGFPEVGYNSSTRYVYGVYEVERILKERIRKEYPVKKEMDGAVAELLKLKAQMDSAYSSYMKQVNDYIKEHIKILPFSYASNWDHVAYLLHLYVNRRGRDIYELINQYELDIKHSELTSALGDIRTEIGNQTKALSAKLDGVSRSFVQATDKITQSLNKQTYELSKKLQLINYSVISTGAKVVNSIATLGKAMSAALSSMQVNVRVS